MYRLKNSSLSSSSTKIIIYVIYQMVLASPDENFRAEDKNHLGAFQWCSHKNESHRPPCRRHHHHLLLQESETMPSVPEGGGGAGGEGGGGRYCITPTPSLVSTPSSAHPRPQDYPHHQSYCLHLLLPAAKQQQQHEGRGRTPPSGRVV